MQSSFSGEGLIYYSVMNGLMRLLGEEAVVVNEDKKDIHQMCIFLRGSFIFFFMKDSRSSTSIWFTSLFSPFLIDSSRSIVQYLFGSHRKHEFSRARAFKGKLRVGSKMLCSPQVSPLQRTYLQSLLWTFTLPQTKKPIPSSLIPPMASSSSQVLSLQMRKMDSHRFLSILLKKGSWRDSSSTIYCRTISFIISLADCCSSSSRWMLLIRLSFQGLSFQQLDQSSFLPLLLLLIILLLILLLLILCNQLLLFLLRAIARSLLFCCQRLLLLLTRDWQLESLRWLEQLLMLELIEEKWAQLEYLLGLDRSALLSLSQLLQQILFLAVVAGLWTTLSLLLPSKLVFLLRLLGSPSMFG